MSGSVTGYGFGGPVDLTGYGGISSDPFGGGYNANYVGQSVAPAGAYGWPDVSLGGTSYTDAAFGTGGAIPGTAPASLSAQYPGGGTMPTLLQSELTANAVLDNGGGSTVASNPVDNIISGASPSQQQWQNLSGTGTFTGTGTPTVQGGIVGQVFQDLNKYVADLGANITSWFERAFLIILGIVIIGVALRFVMAPGGGSGIGRKLARVVR
jgi:hypothetical protein